MRKMQKWSEGTDIKRFLLKGHGMEVMRSPFTEEFTQTYKMGLQNYFAGEWVPARAYLKKSRDMLEFEDGPSAALIELMEDLSHEENGKAISFTSLQSSEFTAPPWWNGFHSTEGMPIRTLTYALICSKNKEKNMQDGVRTVVDVNRLRSMTKVTPKAKGKARAKQKIGQQASAPSGYSGGLLGSIDAKDKRSDSSKKSDKSDDSLFSRNQPVKKKKVVRVVKKGTRAPASSSTSPSTAVTRLSLATTASARAAAANSSASGSNPDLHTTGAAWRRHNDTNGPPPSVPGASVIGRVHEDSPLSISWSPSATPPRLQKGQSTASLGSSLRTSESGTKVKTVNWATSSPRDNPTDSMFRIESQGSSDASPFRDASPLTSPVQKPKPKARFKKRPKASSKSAPKSPTGASSSTIPSEIGAAAEPVAEARPVRTSRRPNLPAPEGTPPTSALRVSARRPARPSGTAAPASGTAPGAAPSSRRGRDKTAGNSGNSN